MQDGAAPTNQSVGFRRLASPLRDFIATENSSAVFLLLATVVALLWANSPWASGYESFWGTELAIRIGGGELSLDLRHWVNDGLMALFFFVVGLEIRRELDMGELRERRRVATSVVAAVGGMVVPPVLYLMVNAGEPSAGGWGIVMGTDTAFALAVLALVAGSFTALLRTFLLTVMIVDDIIALTVIALVYTEGVAVPALIAAGVLYLVVLVMRRAGMRNGVAYFLVGAAFWLATLASGVHATIAGVLMGLLATAYPPSQSELRRTSAQWRMFREQPTPEYARTASRSLITTISPNERLQYLFHPWVSYLIVPLFALANAGVIVDAGSVGQALTSPITMGVVVGLVVGKPLGIIVFSWLATRRWLGRLPLSVPWPALIGMSVVAGIGFTVSLLIAGLSFSGVDLQNAKFGVIAASVLASALSWLVFRLLRRLPGQPGMTATQLRPLPDLTAPVDPEVDHIRGPADAGLTLLEYGDFQCPYCGRAESVTRELVRHFGDELAFVFRHLPLTDVHESAEQAAEAAEAAGAQGKFWEMHDLLLAHQDDLDLDDLIGYASRLGLDVERFTEDLMSRRFAVRVARDVESADESGVAGTPTFFINGRRHHGAYDIDSLTQALRLEAGAVRR
ncbi:MAG TPA: Na+/H+ antiporter NhaA [Acidimicrobiia bacterium]|nr:Na+/H+ antiporter NhaA [Acidimicrobiia bacterium]